MPAALELVGLLDPLFEMSDRAEGLNLRTYTQDQINAVSESAEKGILAFGAAMRERLRMTPTS